VQLIIWISHALYKRERDYVTSGGLHGSGAERKEGYIGEDQRGQLWFTNKIWTRDLNENENFDSLGKV